METSQHKTIIIVCGPTAVGKTAVAIRLAKHFDTEIISADSRQCFKELKIGVARPAEEELQQVKHHFIASHSIREEVTAITFEQYALGKAKELFLQHDVVIMVGGTGLYIKAFCEGLDDIPQVSPETRSRIGEKYKEEGLAWLQGEIREKDPAFFAAGEVQNPQRMMRALEVMEETGQSILLFRKGEKAKRDFRVIKIGLEIPKEDLQRNIRTRVEEMMKEGLPEEARKLIPFNHLNALQTVGYAELFAHFDGKLTLDQAVEEIKIHTRQYAKRQMTWFKRDGEIKWIHPSSVKEMIVFAEESLRSA